MGEKASKRNKPLAPFIAVALMIVPIILDIIFERKKERKVVEE